MWEIQDRRMCEQRFWDDIGEFIFVADDIVPVDCLVILGAPWIELIEHAANLYHADIANKIVACGKYSSKSGRVNVERIPKGYRGNYRTESEMIATILHEFFDVPVSDIIEEPESTNTYENALYGLRAIQAYGFSDIGICCQAFHARRAQMTFESIAPEYRFHIYPAVTQSIDKDTWVLSEYGLTRVLGELERCGRYFPMSTGRATSQIG